MTPKLYAWKVVYESEFEVHTEYVVANDFGAAINSFGDVSESEIISITRLNEIQDGE